jgi:4-amino-4-deoxy-L-arabinose transferase-like glycosyltransferase
MFPGSMLTGAAVAAALRRGFARASDAGEPRWAWKAHAGTLFLLCWTLPAWIVFEAISTRLVHYVMPLYPALALLSARAVLRASAGAFAPIRERVTRIGLVVWAIVGAVLTGAAPVALAVFGITRGDAARPTLLLTLAIIAGVACAGLCASAGWCALRGKALRATLLGTIAMVLGLQVLLASTLPGVRAIWPARNAIEAVRSVDADLRRPLGAVGFHEDSQIFLSHGTLVRLSDDQAAAWAAEHPDALIIARRGTDIASTLAGIGWHEVAYARGYNINRGKWEDLSVLSREPLATPQDEPRAGGAS